jgi:hypothetical protein
MVVSTNPIVLGNMPPEGQEGRFAKIAFMGQVPVRVLGNVQPGDYILPSELGHGFGKAVNPDNMELKDYKKIAGVAWSDMNVVAPGVSMVNVAVGINSNDLTDVIMRQDEKFNSLRMEYEDLKEEIERSNTVLAELIPGYAEATGFKPSANPAVDRYMVNHVDQDYSDLTEADITYASADDILYFEVSREQVVASIDMAMEMYQETIENQTGLSKILLGGSELTVNMEGTVIMSLEEHPFWSRINSDPEYREEILQYIESSLETAFYTQRKYVDRFTGTDMKLKKD